MQTLLFAAFAWFVLAGSGKAVTFERLRSDDQTRILVIRGEFFFGDDTATLVAETQQFAPTVITFDSGGGNIDAALRIGRAIRALGLPTLQLRASQCASACALAFMGGARRFAEAGSIGVHRASFAGGTSAGTAFDISAVQEVTANIIGYMIEMGVDPAVLQLSLSTDSSDMRYLTSTEMQRYRVTSSEADTGSAVTAFPEPQVAANAPPPDPVSTAQGPPLVQSDRLALYDKLDFVGRDIVSMAVSDAPACASACVESAMCRAFTFNSKTRAGRGPNCFLKDSQGQLDGNSSATSGLILRKSDPDAETWMFGAIDPETNLYKDVDVPGNDLSRRAEANMRSPFSCRLACVNERRCVAFTFVSKKKECWLKSGIGKSRAMPGAITGVKAGMTFAPTIIKLN